MLLELSNVGAAPLQVEATEDDLLLSAVLDSRPQTLSLQNLELDLKADAWRRKIFS
jgi:hypothetical protein